MLTGVWACLVEIVLQLQFLLPSVVELTKVHQHNEPLLSGKQELQKNVGKGNTYHSPTYLICVTLKELSRNPSVIS